MGFEFSEISKNPNDLGWNVIESPKGPELIVLIWMCPTMAQTRPTAWSILTATFFGWCPKKTDIPSDKYTNILPDILSCHLFDILTRHFGWHSVRVGGQRACELAILSGSGKAQRAGELAIECVDTAGKEAGDDVLARLRVAQVPQVFLRSILSSVNLTVSFYGTGWPARTVVGAVEDLWNTWPSNAETSLRETGLIQASDHCQDCGAKSCLLSGGSSMSLGQSLRERQGTEKSACSIAYNGNAWNFLRKSDALERFLDEFRQLKRMQDLNAWLPILQTCPLLLEVSAPCLVIVRLVNAHQLGPSSLGMDGATKYLQRWSVCSIRCWCVFVPPALFTGSQVGSLCSQT